MGSWQGCEDMADLTKLEVEIKGLEALLKKLTGTLAQAQKKAKARQEDAANSDEKQKKAEGKLGLMETMKQILGEHQKQIQQLEDEMDKTKALWEELKLRFCHLQTKKVTEVDKKRAGPMLFAFSSMAQQLG